MKKQVDREEMEKKIQDVVDKIVREFHPKKIILFGSYAWGEPTEDSDVDLFIVKESENIQKTEMDIDGSIFPRPFPLDVIVCHPKKIKKRIEQGDFFIKDIFNNGKLLYGQV